MNEITFFYAPEIHPYPFAHFLTMMPVMMSTKPHFGILPSLNISLYLPTRDQTLILSKSILHIMLHHHLANGKGHGKFHHILPYCDPPNPRSTTTCP